MRGEPRFQNARRIEDGGNGFARDIATALDDPYTVVQDHKDGSCYIVWDEERSEVGGGDGQ